MKNTLTLLALLLSFACANDDDADDTVKELTEICDNGVDDDNDNFVDCDDFECECTVETNIEICDNNIDDDGDGFTDAEDSDCQ